LQTSLFAAPIHKDAAPGSLVIGYISKARFLGVIQDALFMFLSGNFFNANFSPQRFLQLIS
jgi:hypothetical protein